MICEDCVAKESKHIENAEFALVDYDAIMLLCQGCLDEYIHVEGEMNLDFFHLEIGLPAMFRRVDEILKYHDAQYRRLLRGYTDLKKNRTSGERANE